MIVYVDQIFIVNFLADFVILHFVAGVSGRRRFGYTLTASAFGGLYATMMYIPGMDFLFNIISKTLVSCVLVLVSCRPKGFRSFVVDGLCFAAVSMFFGGGVYAVLLMSGFSISDILHNSIAVFDVRTPVLMLLLMSVAFVGHIGLAAFGKMIRTKSKTVKLKILHNGIRAEMYGLVDTGCTLCEPKKDRPVIIVDCKYADVFLKNCSDIVMIPYTTVDNYGTFIGFYPDYVKIGKAVVENVAIAVCYSKMMNGKQYGAIINSECLKEEKCFA